MTKKTRRNVQPVDVERVDRIARAIATAEGFYTPHSRPARNHNPGDLERDITGTGVGMDGPYVIYKDDSDGFDALKRQIYLILSGLSGVYTSSMTIREVAEHYTETQRDEWAVNVARVLGVTVETKINTV